MTSTENSNPMKSTNTNTNTNTVPSAPPVVNQNPESNTTSDQQSKATRGQQIFAQAQQKWITQAQPPVQNRANFREKSKNRNGDAGDMPQVPRPNSQQHSEKISSYDKFCKKYDKGYHELDTVVRKLVRSLEHKAQTPKVNPLFLEAWEEFDLDDNNPVVYSINRKYNWIWSEIKRDSPFESIHKKYKNMGFLVKSRLMEHRNGNYFRISVGFYTDQSHENS